ncbi:hypothetical protein DLJ53_21825 [Acuticoccus sediminis]|uniref:Fibronectin type-III domain-containing protein n=1 Tax=Acuticoccus sediminis TaxID=2184697 RepID=A0A8B2NLX9_9HYPH|nr:hypothetical protein [Acuticoccus sediminis]RAH99188.1 hypothetical protein DLJ53_21825 [Acuticoccus sediminis]
MPQLLLTAVAALGVPGLVTSAGGLTALGGVISAGLGIGLNFAAQLLLAPKPNRPKPQDVKNVVRASVTARSRHYGRGRWGGSLAFIETYSGDLYQIVCFGHGRVDAFETFYVDDRPVTLDTNGWATDDPYKGNSVRIDWRFGTELQTAYEIMLSDLPEGVWTADHRIASVAHALIVANAVSQGRFNNVYPNRIPTLNVVGRGARVYDPRIPGNAWSANLALCLRDYLVYEYGGRIDPARVHMGSFSTAADICDEAVPVKAGGTIPRYHGALSYSFEEEPRSVLERFLAAMDGRTYLAPDGRIALLVGKWAAPTITITDGHVIDYDIEDGSGAHRSANEIMVKYTQIEANYSETTADAWRDEASIAAYGIMSSSPELYEIQHHNHARRIAKILAHRANPRWTGTIRTTLFGMQCIDQRWISLQLADLDIDETFEIMSFALDLRTMTVMLTVQSFSSDAYDFDAATEEGDAPAVPDSIEAAALPAPASVSLTSDTRTVSSVTYTDTDTVWNNGEESNNTTTNNVTETVSAVTLQITVAAPPSSALEARAQYRVEPGGAWRSVTLTDDDGPPYGEVSGVARGQTYRARARYVSAGKEGTWVTSSTVST